MFRRSSYWTVSIGLLVCRTVIFMVCFNEVIGLYEPRIIGWKLANMVYRKLLVLDCKHKKRKLFAISFGKLQVQWTWMYSDSPGASNTLVGCSDQPSGGYPVCRVHYFASSVLQQQGIQLTMNLELDWSQIGSNLSGPMASEIFEQGANLQGALMCCVLGCAYDQSPRFSLFFKVLIWPVFTIFFILQSRPNTWILMWQGFQSMLEVGKAAGWCKARARYDRCCAVRLTS